MPNPNEQLADEALKKIREVERTPCMSQAQEAERIADIVGRLVKLTLPPKPQSNE